MHSSLPLGRILNQHRETHSIVLRQQLRTGRKYYDHLGSKAFKNVFLHNKKIS